MKAFIFDFDGVILDSVGVKNRAFRKIFPDGSEEELEKFFEYHSINGGISRFFKIRYFYEDIKGGTITEEEVMKKAEIFGEEVMNNFKTGTALMEDTMKFIKRADEEKIPMHIASGALESELKQICIDLKIDKYFVSIHGSPTPKPLLVKKILTDFNYRSEDCTMFGDSINDFDSANVNGVKFYGYNSDRLREVGEGYLESFEDFKL